MGFGNDWNFSHRLWCLKLLAKRLGIRLREFKSGDICFEETGKTLEDVRGFSQDSATFLDNFDKGVDTSAKNVEEKFGSMQKTISDTVDEINKKNQEIIDQLPEEQQEEAKKTLIK